MKDNIKKNRLPLLDTVRGITVISMVIYHTMWDLVYIYGYKFNFYTGKLGYIWQQSICWTFILLSGFCWNFGKNKLKRGLTVFIAGLIVSLATYIFMPSAKILFGVLTMLGSMMLITIPLDRMLKKIPHLAGGIFSIALFFVARNCNDGFLGFEALKVLQLPKWLYSGNLSAYLGFPPSSFSSADYFSLIPWGFLFLTGYFLYHIMKDYNLDEKLIIKWNVKPLSFIGRHSLIIYMLHQPIIYLILEICRQISW